MFCITSTVWDACPLQAIHRTPLNNSSVTCDYVDSWMWRVRAQTITQ